MTIDRPRAFRVRPYLRWILQTTVLVLGTASSAQAQSLGYLADLALENEPSLTGAAAGLEAARARERQASGSLLPQVTLSADTRANMRGYQVRAKNQLEEKDRFNSHDWQVNVTQPLWRYGNYADKHQAEAQLGQAGFQLKAARQALLAKLVEAWTDLLAARDSHETALTQEAAARQQLTMIQRGLELGLNGQPQREEAEAKYRQAQAETAAAASDLEVKKSALEQLTGPLRTLRLGRAPEPFVSPDTLLPLASLPEWMRQIGESNPDIRAAQQGLAAAREEIEKQLAGYMPSLDLVGNYSQNTQGVGGFPGQAGYDNHQGYVGLQINWALFSSGVQSAKVDEARASLAKAESTLEGSRRSVRNQAKQAWYGLQVGMARYRAGLQALQSARWALKAAMKGQDNGLKAELDRLQARQQLATAQRDLNRGQYDVYTGMFKLMALADMISYEDLNRLDAQFPEDPHPVAAFAADGESDATETLP